MDDLHMQTAVTVKNHFEREVSNLKGMPLASRLINSTNRHQLKLLIIRVKIILSEPFLCQLINQIFATRSCTCINFSKALNLQQLQGKDLNFHTYGLYTVAVQFALSVDAQGEQKKVKRNEKLTWEQGYLAKRMILITLTVLMLPINHHTSSCDFLNDVKQTHSSALTNTCVPSFTDTHSKNFLEKEWQSWIFVCYSINYVSNT